VSAYFIACRPFPDCNPSNLPTSSRIRTTLRFCVNISYSKLTIFRRRGNRRRSAARGSGRRGVVPRRGAVPRPPRNRAARNRRRSAARGSGRWSTGAGTERRGSASASPSGAAAGEMRAARDGPTQSPNENRQRRKRCPEVVRDTLPIGQDLAERGRRRMEMGGAPDCCLSRRQGFC